MHMKETGGDKQSAFDAEWENFYGLAELVMERVTDQFLNEE